MGMQIEKLKATFNKLIEPWFGEKKVNNEVVILDGPNGRGRLCEMDFPKTMSEDQIQEAFENGDYKKHIKRDYGFGTPAPIKCLEGMTSEQRKNLKFRIAGHDNSTAKDGFLKRLKNRCNFI